MPFEVLPCVDAFSGATPDVKPSSDGCSITETVIEPMWAEGCTPVVLLPFIFFADFNSDAGRTHLVLVF